MGTQRYTATKNGSINRLEDFNQYRSLLFAIAYRMLGSIMDAEDMVQETFLRWQQSSEQAIDSTKAYLTTIITRLCIDHLRSARVRREQYIGTWLPEPIVTEQSADPIARAELSDSLAMAFLVLLERLSPIERAVFLLRQVFDYDYEEISHIVEKNPTNCRQIARRARQHLALDRSRFQANPCQQEQLTQQFMQAFSQGDLQGLLDLLADDITLWSDGGGNVVATLKPLHGAQKVARFLRAIHRRTSKTGAIPQVEQVQVNGQAGLVCSVAGVVETVISLVAIDRQIRSLYFIRNPDKLKLVRSIQLTPEMRSQTQQSFD